jgi:hypothetical protein
LPVVDSLEQKQRVFVGFFGEVQVVHVSIRLVVCLYLRRVGVVAHREKP